MKTSIETLLVISQQTNKFHLLSSVFFNAKHLISIIPLVFCLFVNPTFAVKVVNIPGEQEYHFAKMTPMSQTESTTYVIDSKKGMSCRLA